MKIIHKQQGEKIPLFPLSFLLSSEFLVASFAFIEYSSPESAEIGVENMNGVRLDKAHKFSTNLYSELEDLTSISEEFNKPDPQDSKMQENLRSWLLDPRPIDQYCINFSDMTEIYWNEPQRQPEPLYSRQVKILIPYPPLPLPKPHFL